MSGFHIESVLIISAVIVATVVSLPMEPNNRKEDNGKEFGKLRVLTITQEKIEGEYYSPGAVNGIHFKSDVGDDYRILSVTTVDGEPLIIAKQFQESAMLMTVAGTHFLVVNSPDTLHGYHKYNDYVVPQAYHELVEVFLKRKRLPNKIVQQLDDRNSNETRRIAFEDLALHDEIELITEAAIALGKLGITGNEYPAALPFYVLAMRLQQYQNTLLNGSSSVSEVDHTEMRKNRQKSSWLLPALYFAVESVYEGILLNMCVTGRPPRYGDRSQNCFGLCGPMCVCWSWLCGDCCVHQGCVDHDRCCREHGIFSRACWSVWNFSCSPYSC